MKRAFGLLFVVAMGCEEPEERSSPPATEIDLASARLVALSYAYEETTIYWPTSPTSFNLTELARGTTEGGYFYSAYSFSTPEHGGTHLDAPGHFSETGRTGGERLPRGRPPRRRFEPPLSRLRRGGGALPRRGEKGRGPRHRHREHRTPPLHGLHRSSGQRR